MRVPFRAMAKRVEELVVWQLANELRLRVHALAKRVGVREDFRFASQLRDSASGVCRNVAEGFGHVRPTEFSRFPFIARGSLFELQDHFSDGISRQYWSEAELDEVPRREARTQAERLKSRTGSGLKPDYWGNPIARLSEPVNPEPRHLRTPEPKNP